MHTSFNKYHLSTQVGRKSLRDVYIAYPVDEPEHEVVLKVFDASCLPFNYDYEDFVEKANLIKQLNHQYIVPVLDIGIEEGEPYVVSEYLPYGSLRSRMDSASSELLDPAEVLNICLQLGQALSYAHQFNIIHGNIKPDNILFDANGNALLADFSLVGLIDINKLDYKSDAQGISYMAPEQFISSVSEKSDQYSLACIIYELLTGHVPFTAHGFSLMWLKHSTDAPVAPSKVVDNLPKPIEVALLKALASDPAERHDDVAAFIESFRAVSSPLPSQTSELPFVHAASTANEREASRFTLDEASSMSRSRMLLSKSPATELSVTASITDEEPEDAFMDTSLEEEEDDDPYVARSLEEEEEDDPYVARSAEEEEEDDPYVARSAEEEEDDPYVARSLEEEEDDDPYVARSLEEEEEDDPYVARSSEEEEDDPYVARSLEEEEEPYIVGSMRKNDKEERYIAETTKNEEGNNSLLKRSMEEDEEEEEEDRFLVASVADEGAEDPYMAGSMEEEEEEEEEEEDRFLVASIADEEAEGRFVVTSIADEEAEGRFVDAYEDDTEVESDDFDAPLRNPSFPFGSATRRISSGGGGSSRRTTLFKESEDRFVAASVEDEQDDDRFVAASLTDEETEDRFVDAYEDDTEAESDDFDAPAGNPSFPFGSTARLPHRAASFGSRSKQKLKQQSAYLDDDEDDDRGSAVGVVDPPVQQIPLHGEKILAPDPDELAPPLVPPPLPRQPRSKKGPIIMLVVVLIVSLGIVYTRFNSGTTPAVHVPPTPQSTQQPTLPPIQQPTPQSTQQLGGAPILPSPSVTVSATVTSTVTSTPLTLPTASNLLSPTVTAAIPTETPILTETPTPILTETPTPTPTPTPAPQILLTYGYQEFNQYINLTPEGTLDWKQWGFNKATDVDHKAGVTPQISNFTLQGNGIVRSDHVNPINFAWSDGTPVKSIAKSTGAIYIAGLNNGFRITIPASATPRTLRLYVGAYLARGLFSASLNGITRIDGSLDMTHDPKKVADNALYTIKFSSNMANQQITITYTEMNSNGNAGYVLLEAATLQ